MRLMLIIQLAALIILMVLTYFYWHIFRINLQNIETNGFDFDVYTAPSYSFGLRSLVVCAWTVFVGIKLKNRVHLFLLGTLMITLGGIFAMLSLALMFLPRTITIADIHFYWYFYALANIGLTILGFLLFDYKPNVEVIEDYEDVLDHFGKRG